MHDTCNQSYYIWRLTMLFIVVCTPTLSVAIHTLTMHKINRGVYEFVWVQSSVYWYSLWYTRCTAPRWAAMEWCCHLELINTAVCRVMKLLLNTPAITLLPWNLPELCYLYSHLVNTIKVGIKKLLCSSRFLQLLALGSPAEIKYMWAK